ncbi:MAG: hypothetical protein JXQ90_06300 [Cyclobacteriaceae bacterium]
MKINNSIGYLFLLLGLGLMVSCADDDPDDHHDEEVISEVILTFTPDNGEAPIVATWYDADGEGTGAPVIDEIELSVDMTYSLAITFANTLAGVKEDITGEIEEEADEHIIFFGFTEGMFEDPVGNGNIDGRADAVNYMDQDENGLPVGLETTWTTGQQGEGEFRILLKHQPDGLKSATSGVSVGGTDVDIVFNVNIQ